MSEFLKRVQYCVYHEIWVLVEADGKVLTCEIEPQKRNR